jgi:RluA family pseudouridine synthase
MAKTNYIELPSGVRIPILHEDRATLAIDKPTGWMLVPTGWTQTRRNLQAEIETSLLARDFWARSRNLKFLRFVHRLDAETTGVLLFVKSPGATKPYSDLFGTRAVEKIYLAVVRGIPREEKWTCNLPLAPDPHYRGRVVVDKREGKEAVTEFRVLQKREIGGRNAALIEARPLTGRSHQIRVHLAESGHAVAGDAFYEPDVRGGLPGTEEFEMGLRAVELRYVDPFRRVPVRITAPTESFLKAFGFADGPRATPAGIRSSGP